MPTHVISAPISHDPIISAGVTACTSRAAGVAAAVEDTCYTAQMLVWICVLILSCLAACGNPVGEPGVQSPASGESDSVLQGAEPAGNSLRGTAAPDLVGEPVQPPFAVRDDGEGLLLAWFDAEGIHTAVSRSEIPEARRVAIRVDSLSLPPGQRLDANFVYVADMSMPDKGGAYPVRKLSRAAFDGLVDAAAPPAPVAADVVLYKASWCGACKAAEAYMTERGLPFTALDIEKDKSAAAEMQHKVQAAGKSVRGVPVIDFRGEILLGFDKNRLGQLIDG